MHYYQPPNNTPYQFLLDTRLPFHVDINHNVHRNKLMFTDITIPVKGFLCFRVFSLVENKGCNLFYHLLNFHPLSLMRQHLHRNPLNLTRISFLSSHILFFWPMTKISCLSIHKMDSWVNVICPAQKGKIHARLCHLREFFLHSGYSIFFSVCIQISFSSRIFLFVSTFDDTVI